MSRRHTGEYSIETKQCNLLGETRRSEGKRENKKREREKKDRKRWKGERMGWRRGLKKLKREREKK